MTSAATLARPGRGRRGIIGEESLRELMDQGLTNEELAARFACTYRTVLRKKSQLGLTDPHPRVTLRLTDADRVVLAGMVADGWPVTEITATTGWDYATVCRHSPTPPGWSRSMVASFASSVTRIRENAVRPDWLPGADTRKTMGAST